MLEGRQFFAWEIKPVLDAAYEVARAHYTDSLENETSDANWRAAFKDIADIRVKTNTIADVDTAKAESGGVAPSYRRGSAMWELVNNRLAPFKGETLVLGAIANLAVDNDPLSPGKIAAITFGGFAALYALWKWSR